MGLVSPSTVCWGVMRALVAYALVSWTMAAQPPQPPASGLSPAATNTPALGEIVYVVSTFEESTSLKDPFFPKSDRMRSQVATASNEVIRLEMPDLSLRGIAGPLDKRLAMINTVTFEQGEEADIRVGKQVYRVRCLEIRDNSVLISYRNQTKELFLRKGL